MVVRRDDDILLTSLLAPGYYFELDESYDESDEEEVKAHLRRVTEQAPLKLETSSEVHKHNRRHIHIQGFKMFCSSDTHLPVCLSPKKVDFLRVCGLTTLAHRDELLTRKRRKRRRMMRERSLSPPAARGKRKASSPSAPSTPLTTPYSAEQMDSTPELHEKKDFLLMFNLSHVSPQQRRGNNILRVTLLSSQWKWDSPWEHLVSLSFVINRGCRRSEKKES